MTELRRVPVVAPNGKHIVLVVDGNYFEGMDGDFLIENIPIEAIVAVEVCPEDVTPVAAAGWKPESPKRLSGK